MAKGNMFQGMARGKVGDVVFSRLNGQQVSRVRNRNPRNPKTNGQLFQRAIMATVMRAYSAGKEIFDHSFQGFAPGEANQRRFLSLNAKYLRAQVAAQMGITSFEDQKKSTARVVAPGVDMLVGTPLQVSEGTYPLNFFCTGISWEALENESVAQYAQRFGLVPNDIYTLVVIQADPTAKPLFQVPGTDDVLASVIPSKFWFIRFQVLSNVLTNETDKFVGPTDRATLFSKVLNVTKHTPGLDIRFASSEFPYVGELRPHPDFASWYDVDYQNCVYFSTVIRSRLDSDLRSTNYLSAHTDLPIMIAPWGIAPWYIKDAWTSGAQQIGDSDLILEGGDGQ